LKVDKEAGRGLSTNDFTNTLKTKLDSIESGAQVNVIDGVQRNGVDLIINSKKINIAVPTHPGDIGAENISNKSTSTALGTSDILYPSQNAVKAYVDDAVVSGAPDATTTTKGKVKLAGDLSGTADLPTVPGLLEKEPLLPATPINPESKWLNGNRQWAEMVMGSGGYASNVYFTNITSTIVGTYKQTSGTADLTETVASATCNNNEVLIYTYLFEQPVGVTTVDAGVWRFTLNSIISSSVGDSKFKIIQYRRSSTGVETDMFTIYSNTIENTDYQNNIIETVQPSFTVDATDRLGCRVYATTTTTVNKTLSYKVGDGSASYLNTPLALRHSQLRDKNGESLYQHLTSAQVGVVNATSGTNTGDETLTSIKTKLGAATTTSDGYLKYQDFALLHTPTTVTAANGLSISGQNISLQNASLTQSGALTFNDYNTFNSKEPAIIKNTGFNLPLGSTTGTVLEGRTFGTAANSSVGDFQPIENQRLSTTNSPSFLGSTTINSTTSSILELNNTATNGKQWRIQAFSDGRLYFGVNGGF